MELGSGLRLLRLLARPRGRLRRERSTCTDGDPENEAQGRRLPQAGGSRRPGPFHVGDAVREFEQLDGDFDIVFNDIDKDGYPAAWRPRATGSAPGGLYVCDNVLWYGRVAVEDPDDARPHYTEAVLEHNRLIAEDERYLSTIVPTRDGVMVAIRIA